MKISTRLRLAIYIPAIMALAIIVALVISYQDMARTQEAGDIVRQVRSSITELNHFVFSYILYHEERPKQQYLAGHDELTHLLADAQVQTPDQERLLDSIRGNSVTMKDLFLQLVSNYESSDTAGTQELQGTQDRLVGLLLLRSYEADADAASLSSLIDDDIRVNETRTIGLILLVIVLATIPLTIVLVRTRRGITSSLSNLSKGAAVIGSGNLDHKIEEEGNDEIQDLSHAFNQMTANLKAVTASKTDLEREIDERKRIEEALRRSEIQLRAVFDNVDEGLVVSDLNGQFLYWNHTAMKMHGFNTPEEAQRKLPEFQDTFILADKKGNVLPVAEWPLARLLRGEKLGDWEVHIRRVNDDWNRIWEYNGTLMRTEEGTPFLALVTVKDITERKKAEEAVKESEEKYRRIVETTNEGIMVADTKGTITFANPRMAGIVGYSVGELIGKHGIDLVDPSEIASGMGKIEKRKRGVSEEYDIRFRHKNGSIIWLHASGTPISDAEGRHIGNMAMYTDITERKKAEEALKESEARANALIKYAPTGIYEIDFRTGKFLSVNDAMSTLSGYTKEELFALGPDALLDEEDRKVFADRARRQLAGEKVDPTVEYRVKKKDGSLMFVNLNVSFSKVNPSTVFVIGHDITERKKAEEAIQSTLSRFYSVLSDMPLGILLVTADGMGEFANQTFCDMFNLKQPPASFKNKSAGEIIALIRNNYAYPENAVDRITEIVGKLEPVKDEEIPMRDRRIFLRDFVPIHLGEKDYGRLWIHRDITARKKTEETLRETRDYLDNLLNYANAPIIVWNPDFEITRFNHAFERLTGRTTDEVIGKKLSILFPDDSREKSMDFIRKTPVGERWDVVEIPILHRDGTVRVVLWNSASVYAPDGKTPVATIAQGQDITERKKAEEELKRSNTELEASNKELEAFSYSVSHDLRAPLRSMEGFSTALLEDYADKLDDQGKQYLKYVQESSDLMGHLIDDLLKLSRVTRSEMNYEMVNLSEVAQKILTELQKTEPGHKVELNKAPDIKAYGDRNLLRLVLENLLGNAWKFSSKTDSPRIEMGVTMHDGKQAYFVRDNGVGFDMAYSDKLFKPFQRLHKASEFPGTGIGLATVQRIIRRHGGEIWVESKVGEGATFYFTLG